MRLATRIPVVLLACALAAGAAGCGKKGPPVKPPPRLPASPEDFLVRQRGDRVELSASFPLEGLRGRSLRPPLTATLLMLTVPSAAETTSWTKASRDREFLRSAKERALETLDEAQLGETVPWSMALPVDELAPAGKAILSISLRDRWGRSLPASRVVLDPARPPFEPLTRFTAVPQPDALQLIWEGGDERATHVRIYRSIGGSGSDWRPWRVVRRSLGELRDESVAYGQSLRYAACAGLPEVGEGGAIVESTPLRSPAIDYRDVFPPAPPQAVDAVSIERRVRILWSPGGSPDEAFVLVERQREGESAWRELARVAVPETFHVDESVALGVRYRYRVSAIDGAGNRGEPSPPTAWVEPRPPREERLRP